MQSMFNIYTNLKEINGINRFKTKFDSKVLPGIVIHDGDFKIENNIIYIPIFAIDWYLK